MNGEVDSEQALAQAGVPPDQDMPPTGEPLPAALVPADTVPGRVGRGNYIERRELRLFELREFVAQDVYELPSSNCSDVSMKSSVIQP